MLNFLNSSEMIEKTWNIVLFLTLGPESAKEVFAAILFSYIVISVTLAKAHGIGGNGSSSIIVGLIVTAVGIFGMIESAVLCDMLILPLMAKQYKDLGYYISILMAIFLLLIPFTRTFFRTSYGTSFGAWLVAGLVGAGVLMGVDYYYSDNDKTPPTVEAVQKYTKEIKDDWIKKGSSVLKKKKEPAVEKAAAPTPAPAKQPVPEKQPTPEPTPVPETEANPAPVPVDP